MSEHKHEALVRLDGFIQCKTCGQILPSMEETISKVNSATRAIRVLSEIAVAGKYRAYSFDKGFIIYSKEKDGLREEVTAEKIADREYRIYKRISSLV